MATMAAAIAASLPTVQAAPTPAAPTQETLPASWNKRIDAEAEIPITTVQIDGLVTTKIIKHCLDSGSNAHGLVLGLDLDGVLEVSNCFPLPNQSSDEDDKSVKSVVRYQSQMLRSLNEVGSVDGVVGFYQSIKLGAFFKQSLVEAQAIHQEKLRHGGIVIVHDTAATSQGNASFRAFRLTKPFFEAYRRHNFSSASLVNQRLTFSSILEEVPVKIRVNPLLNSVLGTLTESHRSPLSYALPSEATTSVIPPTYSTLNIGSVGLTRNLEQLIEAVDNHKVEESNLAYLSRQIAREKLKVDQYAAKRREENAARVTQGLAPLPEENINRLFKIPPEPSRLESMLLLGQIDGFAKSLSSASSSGLVTMYAAKASSEV